MVVTSAMRSLFLLLTAAVAVNGRCGTGFIQGPSLSDCFKFVSKAAHWYAAEWRCVSLGGHLTSVSSALASSFLKEEVPSCCSGNYWIGGSNDDQDATWEWSDGTPFAYSDWDARQPITGSPLCLAASTTSGKWSAQPCYQSRPYVCKVPAIEDTCATPMPPCNNDINAIGACTCGTTICTAGQICDQWSNTCTTPLPVCPAPPGTAPYSGCKCGTAATCVIGQVCDSYGAGQCTTPLGACPAGPNRGPWKCTCGTSATCDVGQVCDSYGAGCCTTPLATCPTPPATAPAAGCKCGTLACTDDQTCDEATSTCTTPPQNCPAPPETAPWGGCKCGMATCTVGETCDETTSTCTTPLPGCPAPPATAPGYGCTCGSVTCTAGQTCDEGSSTCTTPFPACPAPPAWMPVGQCICGTSATCTAGQVCDSTGAGRCTTPIICPAGANPVPLTCKCGPSLTCDVGQVCDSTGAGSCSTPPICPAPPATASWGACKCGTVCCNVGQICDEATSTCTLPTPPCADNVKVIDACVCGSEATLCYANQYCNVFKSECVDQCVYGATTLTADCECGTNFCASGNICPAADTCIPPPTTCADNTKVVYPCVCGTAAAECNADQYCNVAKSECLDQCAYGATALTADCECGTTFCASGSFCSAADTCTAPPPSACTDNTKVIEVCVCGLGATCRAGQYCNVAKSECLHQCVVGPAKLAADCECGTKYCATGSVCSAADTCTAPQSML